MQNILNYSFLNLLFLLFTLPPLFSQKIIRDAEYSSEIVLTVNKNGSGATYIEKGRYVILNEDGLKFCNLLFYYGFNSKIIDLSASIKSFDGKVVNKLKKADIKDYNAQSSGSLYIDTRYKTFFLGYNEYPFILEYEIKKKYDEVFIYPSFLPKMDYRLLNRESSFKVIVPDSKKINVYEKNIEKGIPSRKGNNIEYEWEIDSLLPIANEPYSYPEYWDMPKVLIAPANFHLEFDGSNNSWKEFGDWIYKLNTNRDKLSQDEIITIDSLLGGTTTNFQKVDALYKYLQNSTRYVSIQEGIEGWQPYTAEYVCENKFGDCKALTNYMLAILKYAGIKSYYTLVKAGNYTQDIVSNFPSNQFNHAILMIPVETDTIWLDCTSKLTPTGFVEKFISDRNVLVINENNSYITRTPGYNSEQNIEKISGTIQINSDLSGCGEACSQRYAHRSTGSRSLHKYYNSNTVKKYSNKWLSLPSYVSISETHTEDVQDFIPYTTDCISFRINIAGKKAGSDLFLSHPLSINISITEDEERITDFFIPESYKKSDSLTYIVPDGYEVLETEKFQFDNEFGSVSFEIISEGNKIILLSSYSMNKGRYEKEKTHDFNTFITNINRIGNHEIIIVRKE